MELIRQFGHRRPDPQVHSIALFEAGLLDAGNIAKRVQGFLDIKATKDERALRWLNQHHERPVCMIVQIVLVLHRFSPAFA